MRMIAWLLTLAFGLAGLAFRYQGGVPHAFQAGTALLVLAGLACPLLWGKQTEKKPGGLLRFTGVRAKDRIMLALAMILAVPILLPWPFWR